MTQYPPDGIPFRAVEAFELVLSYELHQPEFPMLPATRQTRQILDAGLHLGQRRADLKRRDLYPIDVEFGLSVLCRWPLKPPARKGYLNAARDIDYGNLDALDFSVPDETLMMTYEDLYMAQALGDVRRVFRRPFG